MAAIQTYGDISPRTAAYAIAPLLKRGHAELILEKFGQVYTLPARASLTAKFRRYEALSLATTPLVEGVTPSGQSPTKTDYTLTLAQYGDYIPMSDVVIDHHEDPVLMENGALCVQQAGETVETLRYNVVKAGTNVIYANDDGTPVRTEVVSTISTTLIRKCTTSLLTQRAKYLTEIVSSDARSRTEPIEAAFVAIVHPHLAADVRNCDGFIPTKLYGSVSPWANEIGSVEDVRFVRSVLFTPFADAGGAKGSMRSTTGTSADVYPVIIFAKDAYGIVALKGSSAISLIVHNPGKAGSSDPLNQRGSTGWKTMQGSIILNDLWLIRLEVAATA